MADFKTHMVVGAALSGVGAVSLMAVGAVDESLVLTYFFLGSIGGILPDVDLETSVPYRVAFNLFSVVASFMMVIGFGKKYTLVEMALLWSASFLFFKYCAFELLSRFTVHRGMIHSIPAAALSGMLLASLQFRVLDATAVHAWMCGLFLCFGFLVHLALDEIYSVNVFGMKLKKSFGTALKLGSFKDPFATGLTYALVGAAWFFVPPYRDFANVVLNAKMYEQIGQRLWPAAWTEAVMRLFS